MRRYGWIIVAQLLLTSCAASPPNRFYTLSVESPCLAVPSPDHVSSLDLMAVRLPGVVDRPQLVVRTGAHTVDIREFERWAEPLDQMATRILAEDLITCQSLPDPDRPIFRLSITVDEFMADTSGYAHLTGRWWALQQNATMGVPQAHSFSFTEQVDGDQDAQGVAAMSVLLGKLAGAIVSEWRAHILAPGVAGGGTAAAQIASRNELGSTFAARVIANDSLFKHRLFR